MVWLEYKSIDGFLSSVMFKVLPKVNSGNSVDLAVFTFVVIDVA